MSSLQLLLLIKDRQRVQRRRFQGGGDEVRLSTGPSGRERYPCSDNEPIARCTSP